MASLPRLQPNLQFVFLRPNLESVVQPLAQVLRTFSAIEGARRFAMRRVLCICSFRIWVVKQLAARNLWSLKASMLGIESSRSIDWSCWET